MSWHKSTEPYQFTLIWQMEKLTILPTWKCREKSASTWGWIFSFGFPFWDGQYWPWYWVWVVIRGFVLNPWIFILVKLTLRQVQHSTINYWVEMIYLKLYMELLIGKLSFIFEAEIYGWWSYVYHSSEIRGLCMMKWPSEMLQKLPYFWNKKTQIVFHY